MGTRKIDSKAIGNFNIDNDQVYIVNDENFGWTSDDDTISTATTTDVGGIQLYTGTEARGGVLNEYGQTYAVQIESTARPKAFVHVPWTNSQYLATQPDWYSEAGLTTQDLSLAVDEKDLTSVAGNIISTLGRFSIHEIDIAKVVSRNHIPHSNGFNHDKLLATDLDKDNTLLSTTAELYNCIATPLSNEISARTEHFNEEMEKHVSANTSCFNNVCCEISSLSAKLDLSIVLLSDALSNDIDNLRSRIYNQYKVLSSNQTISPWWFKDQSYNRIQVNSLTNSLSTTVENNFLSVTEPIYRMSQTSSASEISAMFSTKQDKLSVRTSINDKLTSDIDIPTVSAVMDFVNSSLQTNTATFRGSFNSLAEVPHTDGSKYAGGEPDENDYMFVDITDDTTGAWRENLKTLEKGTWRFKYVCSSKDGQHGKHGDKQNKSCWEVTGVNGWYEEYLINDAMFTDAQKKAIDSGINSYLVSLIMSYAAIKARLTSELPNMTAKLGELAYLDAITNNITGKGTPGKLAVFDGANSIKSDNTITPKVETWKFTLFDGSTVTKKIVVSE